MWLSWPTTAAASGLTQIAKWHGASQALNPAALTGPDVVVDFGSRRRGRKFRIRPPDRTPSGTSFGVEPASATGAPAAPPDPPGKVLRSPARSLRLRENEGGDVR